MTAADRPLAEALERAVQLDPAHSLAHRWLGLLLVAASPRGGLGPDAAASKDALSRVFAHAVGLAHFAAERYAEALAAHRASSRMNTSWRFFVELRDAGREAADAWLDRHYADIGVKATLDLRSEFR